MNIKKPHYIRKKDFINYLLRPQDQLFWSNNDIQSFIDNHLNSDHYFDENDDEFEDEKEFDSKEYVDEMKINNEKLDENDPKVIEGIIIDQKSRDFIKRKYSEYEFIDFDIMFNKNNNFDDQYHKTIELLESKSQIIIFQPTFLAFNKAIAKPDAFIKHSENNYTIIETKSTTSPKIHHFLDVFYQNSVINETKINNQQILINDFFLCVPKYQLNKKNDINFVLTNKIPFTKSAKSLSEKQKKMIENKNKWSNDVLKMKSDKKLCVDQEQTIKDEIYGNFPKSKKGIIQWLDDNIYKKSFNEIINEIYETNISNSFSLEPSKKYSNPIKNYDFINNLKKYYSSNKKYWMFHFSGKLIQLQLAIQIYEKKLQLKESTKEFINNNAFDLYCDLFSKSKDRYIIFSNKAKSIFNNFTCKKVYFDFESINLAIAPIDNIPPFTQVVNQVSVIFDDNTKKFSEIKSNNILIDPISLDKNSFKKIIDAVYCGNDCKYIVFNRHFEITRLKEMADYINEKKYFEKVKDIISNIFDLAEFFIISKNNDEYIFVKELCGYYSIKKILPLVNKYAKNIFDETKCLEYSSLENVHNGSEAQNASNLRALNKMNDNEWKKIEKDLKIYCENDVRAMAAVEYWLKQEIKKL